MPLALRSLGSGSSGNSFVATNGDQAIVVDAGFSKRRMVAELRHLQDSGLSLAAIVLTHEHFDHSRGAIELARVSGAPIVATRGTLNALAEGLSDPTIARIAVGSTESFDIASFSIGFRPVRHDAQEPVGLSIAADDSVAVIAIDLGTASKADADWMSNCDLLVIESNHDSTRLMNGPYPGHLKRRIAGRLGHLSNDQAAACIAQAVGVGRARVIWLAHLSEVNNTRTEALHRARREVADTEIAVAVCARDRPSLTWSSGRQFRQATLW